MQVKQYISKLWTDLSFAHFAFSITIPLINWPFSWPLYNKIDIFQNQMVSAPLNWLARYAFDIRSEITMRESNENEFFFYMYTYIYPTKNTNRMDMYVKIALGRHVVCAIVEARPYHSPSQVRKAQSFSCANVAHLIKMWKPIHWMVPVLIFSFC